MSDTHDHSRESTGYARTQAKANTGRKRRTNRALRRTGREMFKRGAWNFHKRSVPAIEEDS